MQREGNSRLLIIPEQQLHLPTLSKELKEKFGILFGIFAVSTFITSTFLHSELALGNFSMKGLQSCFNWLKLAFLPATDGFNEPMDDDDLPQELVSYFETRYTGGERC